MACVSLVVSAEGLKSEVPGSSHDKDEFFLVLFYSKPATACDKLVGKIIFTKFKHLVTKNIQPNQRDFWEKSCRENTQALVMILKANI